MSDCRFSCTNSNSGAARLIFGFALFFLLQPLLPVHSAAQSTNTSEDLIRRATFIFRGTVQKVGASTMPAVPAGDSVAVVRVDEVLEGPGLPPDLAGQKITVQLLAPKSVKAGEQAVFYTKGWLLGNSMAVIEVGQRPMTAATTSTVRGQIKTTRQKMADEQLQSALQTAEAVIVGKVVSVRPAQIPHLGSEHDPDWYEARVAVESTLRGGIKDQEVSLLFPNSDDVMWRDSPKYKEGQAGIFLLHRNQARLPGIENRFTTLKAPDFHSVEQLSRIKRLMGAEK